jgi:CheY-like chemotaxis protein
MATILIVDDLSVNRAFLATLLRDQGHRLLEAANGSDGLASAQADHPDLVITDVLMPMMDGYELVRQLRLDPTTSRIPVVFYTAHYGAREARALALSGACPTS